MNRTGLKLIRKVKTSLEKPTYRLTYVAKGGVQRTYETKASSDATMILVAEVDSGIADYVLVAKMVAGRVTSVTKMPGGGAK